MSEGMLTELAVKDMTDERLGNLLDLYKNNLKLVKDEIKSRKPPKTSKEKKVVATEKASDSEKANASEKKKKVKPTIKDMQHILDSHSISYKKSSNKAELVALIKKHNKVRETEAYAATQKE